MGFGFPLRAGRCSTTLFSARTDAVSQVSVVTGATGGIGRWIALGLAQAGHHVVMVGRNAERSAAAAAWIMQRHPGASLELRQADLSSLAATRQVGREIGGAHRKIGLLVNNAGIFEARRQQTVEGHDSVLAVNHLAPYVLTDILEPALRAGAPARIVNIGSSTADRARIDPANLELSHGWAMKRAYARSKLAMMAMTFTRAGRLQGSGVIALVVHPGTVATGLIREGGMIGLAWRIMARFTLTEEQGADTPLFAALSLECAGLSGVYLKKRRVVVPNRRALDPDLTGRIEAATRSLITLGPFDRRPDGGAP